MNAFLGEAKIVICMGTGGVGKTTIASGLAAMMARRGLKVLVLTVDPSKRLKQSLGLDESGIPRKVSLPALPAPGELWGAVMNTKKTFDDFVMKAAGDSPDARKILDNRLYQQLSTTLAGSQEFTALENLLAADKSEKFDLIVLDTPPAHHAFEFLQAPQKLASIFNEGVAKWFRTTDTGKPRFLAGIFQAGTKQTLKILESLTGAEFMGQLGEFFSQIHSWQGQLETRAVESQRLLARPSTHFILITAFDEAKFQEGELFAREIRKSGYNLSSMVINRAHPMWFQSEVPPSSTAAASLQHEFRMYFQRRREKIGELKSRLGASFQVIEVPEQTADISSPSAVWEFSKILETSILSAPEKT